MVQVFLPGPKVARYDLPLGSSPRGTLTPPKTDSTQYHPYSDHVGHVEPCLRRLNVFHLTSSRPMPAKRRSEISRRRVCSAKTGGHSSKDQSKTRHQTSRKPWLRPTLGEAGWPIPHNQLPLGPAKPSSNQRGEKQTVTFAKESWTLPSRGCSNLCAYYIGKWYARRDTQRSMCSLE